MRAAQNGDPDSYRRLLREAAPFLRSVLRGKLPGDHVEDVVQDVLLTVHRVRHSYDASRPFTPWLVAIAQRRAIDWVRKRGRVSAFEFAGESLDHVAAEPEPDPVDRDRWAARLHDAVRKLPHKQRDAVEMVKLREMTIAEAALTSGQTQGAVKVNVHRGLIALRRLLAGEKP